MAEADILKKKLCGASNALKKLFPEGLKMKWLEYKWEIAEKMDHMTDLAFGLSMISLGEDIKWSAEKIKKFMPMGLLDGSAING